MDLCVGRDVLKQLNNFVPGVIIVLFKDIPLSRTNNPPSAMQRYIEALGGQLEIKAIFQEGKEELIA